MIESKNIVSRLTDNINRKFWKTEWLVIGLGSFSLNLYFLLINSYSNAFFFTFLIISMSIIILTLKLYDNELQRESAFDLLDAELSKIEENAIENDEHYPTFHTSESELKQLLKK